MEEAFGHGHSKLLIETWKKRGRADLLQLEVNSVGLGGAL